MLLSIIALTVAAECVIAFVGASRALLARPSRRFRLNLA